MPKYRLTYFQDEGRAEAARQMLEIAGADWEDIRITPAQWKDMQASEFHEHLLNGPCWLCS